VVDELFQAVSLTARILTLQRDVERAVKSQNAMTLLAALGDVKAQLSGLIYPGFIARTGLDRLRHLPRYLQGALERVRALADNPGRDRQRLTEFERAAALYAEAGGALPCRRCAAGDRARTLAARGVPREPVRPGARHRRAGLAPRITKALSA
jgi:ATP-dependent helicase HrpA